MIFPKQTKAPLMPLKPNMEDVLIVAFDRHAGERDMLLVYRVNGDEKKIINVFKDHEADDIYRQLVGGTSRWNTN